MLLWFTIAALTVAAVAVLVRPIFAGAERPATEASAGPAPAANTPDIEIYRDQLAEIDRDLARGLVDANEAEAARREVARRLLAHAPGATVEPQVGAGLTDKGAATARARLAAVVLAAFVPLAAVLMYVALGDPGMPGMPHAARLTAAPERSPLGDLVGRVEARLKAHPEDGAGWDVIAPVYMRLNRFADAANDYAHASRLLGETPERLLGLAEATVLANKGAVTAAARAAFEKMQKLAPDRPEPRFWLAHAREQDGDLKGAAAAYRTLLTAAPANAPWAAGVREQLADVERRLAGGAPDTTSRPAPPSRIARGPTAADVKAAETMTPADRMRMIEGMVDGLAARLKENGKDLEGWMKLVRAYKVLGRDPAALTAIADARKALAGDAKALGAIDELARSLGLGS